MDNASEFSTGNLFIAPGASLPQNYAIANGAPSTSWTRLDSSTVRTTFESDLRTAGWNFFFIAGALNKSSFGFNRQKTSAAVLKKLTKEVGLQNYNCLEIGGIVTGSLLGIPYVSVSGHARHIQKGMVLHG